MTDEYDSYGADWNRQDGSESHYGTFDQGGNLYEWNETIIIAPDRDIRGGSWANSDVKQRSYYRDFTAGPTYESQAVGFRVALVPVSASSVPPSLSLALSAGDPLQLTLAGSLGQAFEIEVSDTLMDWDPSLSVTLSVETWTTNFAHQAELPRRFWRARLAE